jgi:hypothetical protein
MSIPYAEGINPKKDCLFFGRLPLRRATRGSRLCVFALKNSGAKKEKFAKRTQIENS